MCRHLVGKSKRACLRCRDAISEQSRQVVCTGEVWVTAPSPIQPVITKHLSSHYCNRPWSVRLTSSPQSTFISQSQPLLLPTPVNNSISLRIYHFSLCCVWACFSLAFFTATCANSFLVVYNLCCATGCSSRYYHNQLNFWLQVLIPFPQQWCWGQVVTGWRQRSVSHLAWPSVKAVHFHRQVLQPQREQQGHCHYTGGLH